MSVVMVNSDKNWRAGAEVEVRAGVYEVGILYSTVASYK